VSKPPLPSHPLLGDPASGPTGPRIRFHHFFEIFSPKPGPETPRIPITSGRERSRDAWWLV